MISGIYRFINLINGKMYIGSAINIHNRKKRHLNILRLGNHYNFHFQAAWNKYGEVNFNFEILEYVELKEQLLKREQYWLDKFKSFDILFGYNIFPTAGSPLGYIHTNEAKAKLSFAAKNKTDAHRLVISKTHKGKITSNETKIKMSLAKLGKTKSKETRARMSLAKRNLSEETRQKMSEGQFRRHRERKIFCLGA